MSLLSSLPMLSRRRRCGAPPADGWRLLGLGALTATLLALAGAHAGPASAAARLAAPRQASPAADAVVEAMPSFAWKRVRSASRYEFQLSADSAFKSIVLGQGNGSYQTPNTAASITRTVADGSYFWRVRGITAKGRVGHWSSVRSLVKRWTVVAHLTTPVNGATVAYPETPLVLRWSAVPNAFKYRVVIATDPSLAHSALGNGTPSVETSGTAFAWPGALAPGRYYWSVTPLDGEKLSGRQSAVSAFDWSWPTATTARVTDLDDAPGVFDPQLSWDAVAGAAQYQVEINPSQDFAGGSRVCCDEVATGTSLSPLHLLPNNTYYWRMRAMDSDGNAGQWNRGPDFRKGFDDVTPSIPGLRLRDNVADSVPAAGPSGVPSTGSPVVEWDPVQGASSYEVRVAPWAAAGYCDWTAPILVAHTFLTATTAWTPLAKTLTPGSSPVGNAFQGSIATDQSWALADATDYCVRVRARSDRDTHGGEIVSDWAQLGGVGHQAFTYKAATVPSSCGSPATPAQAYHSVDAVRRNPGGPVAEMPLFTWDRVADACGYFVVVARDEAFTKVIDVAYTLNPTYAPRLPATYADETTRYYWAVMPTASSNGTGLGTAPSEDNPQSFEKQSTPPQRIAPASGSEVTSQPSFRWTEALGAREYHLQVDDDPTFGSPIDDVITDATAFTSTSTYAADTVLYWRVRADDENKVGLTWSDTGTFRRRLPLPVVGENPLGGEAIPVLSWAPVAGAISYDMHVEQADGTRRDFTMRSAAFSPVVFYGTGIWRWQVRANFRSGFRTVSGGYSPPVSFARRIATPARLRVSRAEGGALVSWAPATMARQYRVQFSDSDSFATILEQANTDHTSFAPKMASPVFAQRGALYWRVAALDEGGNAGGWAEAPLTTPKKLRVRVRGVTRRNHRGIVRVTVTDSRGHRLAHVRVTLSGAGVTAKPRTTGRSGTVAFRIRPSKKGTLTFRAEARQYRAAASRVRVR